MAAPSSSPKGGRDAIRMIAPISSPKGERSHPDDSPLQLPQGGGKSSG